MSNDNKDLVDSTETNVSQNTDTNNEERFIAQSEQSEPKQSLNTIDIDGHRPVDPSNLQIQDTLDIDGQRPVVAGDVQVQDTFDIDGQRPIASGNLEFEQTLDVDGHRPIDPSALMVQDTLDIDGQRPITSVTAENPEIPTDYID